MYADFYFYYGLDLSEMLRSGTPTPRILALIARLPVGSMTRAMEIDREDWHEYFGADQQYYQLAAIYDAVNVNTASTGMYKKPPKFEPWPTPGAKARKKARSVRDMYALFGGGAAQLDESGLMPVVPN